jgi:hypothetical protein
MLRIIALDVFSCADEPSMFKLNQFHRKIPNLKLLIRDVFLQVFFKNRLFLIKIHVYRTLMIETAPLQLKNSLQDNQTIDDR